jgi:Zn-dependent protease with chaperone function
MTLWTAGLFAFAWAADRLLARRVRPAWRIGLYGAVFARVLLPNDWHSPVSLWPVTTEAPAAAAGTSGLVGIEAPALLSLGQPDLVVSAATGAAPSFGAAHVVGLVYVLVAVALLAWLGRGYLRLRAIFDAAQPASPRIQALARGTRVLEHPSAGPLTFGALRPAVLVPQTLAESLTDAELRCILDHERAHVVRRDPLMVCVLSIATALLWPLLPVWFAGARIRRLDLRADLAQARRPAARPGRGSGIAPQRLS